MVLTKILFTPRERLCMEFHFCNMCKYKLNIHIFCNIITQKHSVQVKLFHMPKVTRTKCQSLLPKSCCNFYGASPASEYLTPVTLLWHMHLLEFVTLLLCNSKFDKNLLKSQFPWPIIDNCRVVTLWNMWSNLIEPRPAHPPSTSEWSLRLAIPCKNYYVSLKLRISPAITVTLSKDKDKERNRTALALFAIFKLV